jgi:hypothetical protein
MPYPTIRPTTRSFSAGDYPVKTFKAQSGAEVRILYGSKRTGMSIDLTYENIADSLADDFVAHYDEVKGQFGTFALPSELRAGWSGNQAALDASGLGAVWRYAKAPSITSVRPGISSVQIQLVGVL